MIGRFDRIEVTFGGRDGDFNIINGGKFVAHTHEDMDEIERKYSELDHYRYVWKMFKDKFVKCGCGREVCCSSFTNTCECGRDYGFDGSLLADRSQWGEETGEHWSEVY